MPMRRRLRSEELEKVSSNTWDGVKEEVLRHRLGEGLKTMGGLAGLWRNRERTTHVKVGMLKCIVVIKVLNCSESQVVNEREKKGGDV